MFEAEFVDRFGNVLDLEWRRASKEIWLAIEGQNYEFKEGSAQLLRFAQFFAAFSELEGNEG